MLTCAEITNYLQQPKHDPSYFIFLFHFLQPQVQRPANRNYKYNKYRYVPCKEKIVKVSANEHVGCAHAQFKGDERCIGPGGF
jgi:hypothetical protein